MSKRTNQEPDELAYVENSDNDSFTKDYCIPQAILDQERELKEEWKKLEKEKRDRQERARLANKISVKTIEQKQVELFRKNIDDRMICDLRDRKFKIQPTKKERMAAYKRMLRRQKNLE